MIEAKYKLSIHQQRVLFTLLEKIHSSDDDFMHYDIDIGDIAEKFGLENGKALYAQMQEAISDLVTKKLRFKKEVKRSLWRGFLMLATLKVKG